MMAPEARRTNSGDHPRPERHELGYRRRREVSDLLSKRKALVDLTGRSLHLHLRSRGGLARVVGDDHVGTRATDAGQRFEHHPLLVEPAVLRRRFQHRILAADLVSSCGLPEPFFHFREHIEVGERRLDQHDVGPLGDVDFHFAQGFFDVGRIELMAATIAELRR